MKNGKYLLGVFLAIGTFSAAAAEHDTETRGYAGLSWQIGHGAEMVPDLVVGVRSLRVSSADNVQGADLNARVSFKGGATLNDCRLVYVGGERDIMGNVGVGYSFSGGKFLGTAAVQGAYSRVGVDYLLGNEIRPYVEINTLSKPDNVVDGNQGSAVDPDA